MIGDVVHQEHQARLDVGPRYAKSHELSDSRDVEGADLT